MALSTLEDWAAETAQGLIADLGRRRDHVRHVAALAADVANALDGDVPTFIAAAWLHDIGYASGLAKTGFHPLDGARFLRDEGCEDLALLVAHHSGARHEASIRGIDDYLDE